jgi:phage terminase large subunit
MGVWRDPILKPIPVPEDIKNTWFSLGSYKYQLLPTQYHFLAANEEYVSYMGAYGCGKTRTGALKAVLSSMYPNNRGIVGRLASTDLEQTTERDLLDLLQEAELLKEAPNSRNKTAIVHCIDPATGANLGYTSEISFQHLDDPRHLRGRHIGWSWIDEASEVDRKAWQNLIGRQRWAPYKGRYQAFATGNTEGHNWIYDFFFNEEAMKQMICGKPDCRLSAVDCNRQMRLKRRGLHATTYENYFLPPDYISNMASAYTAEERARYMEGSFDIFEGAVFKEFNPDLHVLSV